MKGKIFEFKIDFPFDQAAGLHAYNEEVEMKFRDGGMLDGDDKEFVSYMCEILEEWFDGADVYGKRKR